MTEPQPGLLTGDDINWDVMGSTEDPPPVAIREDDE